MGDNVKRPENDADPSSTEPSLWDQTVELGTVLRDISNGEPEGTPSDTAAMTFRHWLASAEPHATDKRYFQDVAAHYDIQGRSNRDLFDIFELLHPYVEIEEPEEEDVAPRTFISLPVS